MKRQFDVIVIGGGPAGIMSAISAATLGTKVALFEKNKRLGKKLLMTGGGRCNVTNNQPVDDLIAHIPGNGRFLYSTFSQWDNQDIMAFFQERNIALKEEDHGRIFPVSDKSKTIVSALEDELVALGVDLNFQTPVAKLIHNGEQLMGVRTEEEDVSAKSIIIATGGLTYPSTGATGDGYQFAKTVGHHITPLYPTESPINLDEDFIKDKTLQGLSLRDVRLSVMDEKNKEVTAHEMDLLFTHFGLSGPAALRCSGFVNQLLKTQQRVSLKLDCFPSLSKEELLKDLLERIENSSKSLKNSLSTLLPERLLTYFLNQLNLGRVSAAQVKKQQLLDLIGLCKNWNLVAKSTFGLERSFVTGGGIDLKEIDPKTMSSKKNTGLFFAGEVMDIHGYTGGFNITAALCTGHVAGTHAAYHAFS
ncbi:hypothetical protein NRIC_36320 [Enterococcus florum]|uniref:Flavoprotein n=1 Tax=Enterococcus florum TaxID=2480627 RepID=A0A4P5PH38_9ENTE|nr:NAD(P)/FAD-dependent oxidoreductase [Enterococcus florum]GCF95741.1 hypothetical protein NRIC_36320 [Enterococcus florum]